jgi:hypothetical protein
LSEKIRLLAEFEGLDQLVVALAVGALEVVEQAAALADELEQATT